jgi:hypothetical protein
MPPGIVLKPSLEAADHPGMASTTARSPGSMVAVRLVRPSTDGPYQL